MTANSASAPLKMTPLNAAHRQLGARMVDFGGWDMPVQYSGIVDEHHAVRRAVGLFDVSHMGEIVIRGPQAFDLIDYLTPNAVSKLKPGQAHYSALLYDHGGFVDDILVHKVSDTEFFLCVNASNQDKDFQHILEHKGSFDAEVDFASDRYALIATQGPHAIQTLQKLTAIDLSAIKYYWFADGEIAGIPARLARTGYTGEVGFEAYVAPEHAVALWNAILAAGEEFGIKPAGLGAATRCASKRPWPSTATKSRPPSTRLRPRWAAWSNSRRKILSAARLCGKLRKRARTAC